MRWLLVVALVACHFGGEYSGGGRRGGTVDRGETNGRMFDFVSDKPEGDDWQIRIRGTSLFASYSLEQRSDKYGPVNLLPAESDKVWALIDKVDVPQRKHGKKDEDGGTVTMRLREPGDDQHDIFTIYMPRDDANDDEDVAELAKYLQKLVAKYFNERPNF